MHRGKRQLRTLARKLHSKKKCKPVDRKDSASIPGAQSHGLCRRLTDVDIYIDRCVNIIEERKDVPQVVRAVLEVLFLNGARISEVLKATGKNITPQGNIIVKGSKGSSDRLLVVSYHRDFWLRWKNNNECLGDVFSRFFFYRYFRKLGLSMSVRGSSRSVVTHSLRHLLVQSGMKVEETKEILSKYIGHKSIKSIEYYE